MTIIYHSKDLDGYCSGAICKLKYPEATLIGYDYGQPIPELPKGEPVIMVDVSVPMETMEQLAANSGDFLWIDHHASAIKDFHEYIHHLLDQNRQSFIKAVLKEGIAACEIAWGVLIPDRAMPVAVELLGEYDTWRNGNKARWENEILPFQYGMREICTSAETFPMHLLGSNGWDENIDSIIQTGKAILSYQRKQNTRFAKSAFERKLDGLRAICLNAPGGNSQMFNSVYDEAKHDLMVPFCFDGKQWVFSVYATKEGIDCSAIAKTRGGGGHKQAAGFRASDWESVWD